MYLARVSVQSVPAMAIKCSPNLVMGSCESCLGSCYPHRKAQDLHWPESRCIVDPSNCLPELFLSSHRQTWVIWISGPSVPQPSKPNNTGSYDECIKCNGICSIPFLLTVAAGSHNFEFPAFFCLFDFFIMLIPFLWHRVNGRNIYLIFLFQELRLAPFLKICFFLS